MRSFILRRMLRSLRNILSIGWIRSSVVSTVPNFVTSSFASIPIRLSLRSVLFLVSRFARNSPSAVVRLAVQPSARSFVIELLEVTLLHKSAQYHPLKKAFKNRKFPNFARYQNLGIFIF